MGARAAPSDCTARGGGRGEPPAARRDDHGWPRLRVVLAFRSHALLCALATDSRRTHWRCVLLDAGPGRRAGGGRLVSAFSPLRPLAKKEHIHWRRFLNVAILRGWDSR